MRHPLLLALLIIGLAQSQDIKAQEYKTALGVRLSNDRAVVNHSVSLKHFFGSDFAVDALFTFSDPVAIGILLEKHKPTLLRSLNWYFGGGGYLAFSDPKPAGLQFVLGLDFKFPSLPLNLSADWKPELNLSNPVHFEPVIFGGTLRFVFH